MKKRSQPRKKLNYDQALKMAAKEEVTFFGHCSKFCKPSNDPAPIDRAIHFLFLKDNVIIVVIKNVDRKTALSFGKRRVCKIDCTRQFDGPASSRIMKTQKLLSGAINGWHNGAIDPKYELGSGYRTDVVGQVESSFQLKQNLVDERVQTSERDREAFKKYNISKVPPERLTQELCKLKEETFFNNTKFIQVDGLKLFHILKSPNHPPTILQDFEAFSTIEQVANTRYKEQAKHINNEQITNLYDYSQQKLRQRALTNLHEFKRLSNKRLSIPTDSSKAYQKLRKFIDDEPKSSLVPSQQNTSRSRSQASLIFNLTNRQTIPSASEKSQNKLSLPRRVSKVDQFQNKVEEFVMQRLSLYNSKSQSPDVDYTNLQKSQDRLRQFQLKEFKRIQKISFVGAPHSQR